MGNINTVRVLHDDPTSDDEFESHSRVASAIARVLQTEEEGIAVALVGNWGSGKSSVVKMLQSKIEGVAGKDFHALVFDAWAHQGDPLRRTFLEQLIGSLEAKGWILEGEFDKAKDQLARRIEESTIKTHARPTIFGVLMVLSLALMPFGVALFANWRSLADWAGIFGLAVCSLPFVVLGWGGVKYFRADGKEKENVLAWMVGKSDKTIESKSSKTAEPTSVEFFDIFCSVLDSALKDERRNMLFVMDNLDRVESADAILLWSTMRTFFEVNSSGRSPWRKRVWLLVPFDPSGIAKLWSMNPSKSGEGERDENETPRRARGESAASFIDKTFQVKFEVPLPVRTDWRKFFLRRFEEAFPGFDDDTEVNRVLTIYETATGKNVLPPTPREVKLFLNDMVAQVQVNPPNEVSGYEIPLHVQGLYVLMRREVPAWSSAEGIMNELRSVHSDTFHSVRTDNLPTNYKLQLAALHFGVPVGKAAQILLYEPLRNSIRSKDAAQWSMWMGFVGSQLVLRDLLQAEGPYWTPDQNFSVLWIAAGLDEVPFDNPRVESDCWYALLIALSRRDSWPHIDEREWQGLVCTVKRSKDRGQIERLCNTLASSAMIFQMESLLTLEGLTRLIETLESEGYGDILSGAFDVPGDAKEFSDFIDAGLLSKRNWMELNRFRPVVSGEEVVLWLADVAARAEEGEQLNRLSEFYYQLPSAEDWDWEPLITAARSRLEKAVVVSSVMARTLLLCLLRFKTDYETASDALRELVQKNSILHHLNTANSEGDEESKALCICIKIIYAPTANANPVVGNSSAGLAVLSEFYLRASEEKELVGQVLRNVCEFAELWPAIKAAWPHSQLREFSKTLAELAFDEGVLFDRIDSEVVLEDSTALLSLLGHEKYGKLIENFVDERDLRVCFYKRGFLQCPLIPLVTAAQQRGTKYQDLRDFFVAGLSSVDRQAWQEDLKRYDENQYSYAHILVALVLRKVRLGLKINFLDALNEYGPSYPYSGATSETVGMTLPTLIGALKPSHRRDLLVEWFTRVIDVEISCGAFISNLGESAFDQQALAAVSDRLLREGYRRFKDQGRLDELKWIRDAFTNGKDIRWRESNSWETFEERLKRDWAEADLPADQRAVIEEIAAAAELQLPAPAGEDLPADNAE